MEQLIKVLAQLELFSEGRKTAFHNGYRPLFNFKNAGTKISGRIDLIHVSELAPGALTVVQLTFINGIINADHFKKGEQFTFDEGTIPLGKGEIIAVLTV